MVKLKMLLLFGGFGIYPYRRPGANVRYAHTGIRCFQMETLQNGSFKFTTSEAPLNCDLLIKTMT